MVNKRSVQFAQYMDEMQNDPEYQEFMDWYNKTVLRLMFIGLYAFLAGGFFTAVVVWNLSLAFGWVALAGIVTGGVLWSRWYYNQWPWVI
jgi:hypothetical protein